MAKKNEIIVKDVSKTIQDMSGIKDIVPANNGASDKPFDKSYAPAVKVIKEAIQRSQARALSCCEQRGAVPQLQDRTLYLRELQKGFLGNRCIGTDKQSVAERDARLERLFRNELEGYANFLRRMERYHKSSAIGRRFT